MLTFERSPTAAPDEESTGDEQPLMPDPAPEAGEETIASLE
jgi:hypothetical protein